MREIKLSMAMASHLSDVQHLIAYGDKEKATKLLNFVKKLIFEHHDLDAEVTTDYLDSIWNSL
jgi:hypothetical protein